MTNWHGWGEATGETLHIGKVPGRKQVALYRMVTGDGGGCTLTPLAYFADEAKARIALELLDRWWRVTP